MAVHWDTRVQPFAATSWRLRSCRVSLSRTRSGGGGPLCPVLRLQPLSERTNGKPGNKDDVMERIPD
jgi:hypothetical protein